MCEGGSLRRNHQSLRNCLDIVSKASPFSKRCAIVELPVASSSLGPQQLNHFAHCHSGREAMRVHDKIWSNSSLTEGQICLCYNIAHYSLLTVPAAEFVT